MDFKLAGPTLLRVMVKERVKPRLRKSDGEVLENTSVFDEAFAKAWAKFPQGEADKILDDVSRELTDKGIKHVKLAI